MVKLYFADIALPNDYTVAKGSSPTEHASTHDLEATIAQQAEEIKQLRIENNLLKELMKNKNLSEELNFGKVF